MISDLHVHTCFSVDSSETMASYCEEAILKGVRYICFTDHVDYNKTDDGYGYYKPEAYYDEFRRVQDLYSDKVELLCGIEFSEPHLYPGEFETITKLNYDFILGSIHYWFDDLFASELQKKGITLEDAFERYWKEVYKAVSFGGFDSLAHIDFPKRYYKDCISDEDTMYDIFKMMVKNNISLEINTSSLRKGLNEAMPGRDLLELYEKAGGGKVTIGSDAHKIDELAKGYNEAIAMITPALVNGFYKDRKFIPF